MSIPSFEASMSLGRTLDGVRDRVEYLGFAARYRLADATYALGVATPKRTVAGTYWSYEPTNAHGDDPGLAALDTLPTDAVVFDVGAHVGEYAVPLALDTERRIVAFEPNGQTAERLARTAARNGVDGRITLRRMGVGAEDELRTFYRSTFPKLSSFNRFNATRWGATVEATTDVPVRRLDSLVEGELPTPDGIKIDAEGVELAVLRGGAETIATARPLVVIEHHEHAPGTDDRETIATWLRDRKYEIEVRGDVWLCRPA